MASGADTLMPDQVSPAVLALIAQPAMSSIVPAPLAQPIVSWCCWMLLYALSMCSCVGFLLTFSSSE